MKAILWDMDGTLIDSEPLHEKALVDALAELGLEASPDLHDHVLGMSAEDVHAWLQREVGLTESYFPWMHRKYRIYMDGVKDLPSVPGALETWKAAEAAGLAQAVASNSDRIVVEANLGHMGLISPRMVSVSRNDVRKGKPHPEIYLRAAYLVGADPSDCVVMEDSRTGAAAGLAAGMKVFLVPTSAVEPPAGAEKLADFSDLTALFPR